MWHDFTLPTDGITLPKQFTYPFCYTPHPLCRLAVTEVQHYLKQRTDWQDELAQGKMFGVLVVQRPDGAIGFTAAFSGILAGKNLHSYFVPPVYDLLQPDGFFKKEEANISLLNLKISQMQQDADYLQLLRQADETRKAAEQSLTASKQQLKQKKLQRDLLRSQGNLSAEQTETLIRESQQQKAEYKRLERHWKSLLTDIEQCLKPIQTAIEGLKEERKHRSAALQQKLFSQFRMLNARGEERDLCDIFCQTVHQVPPAGAGECAAPKLLQNAYRQGWKPLCMAEFWWGASPKTEIRHHGHYYPACRGKCGPILAHMLQGLDVEINPLSQQHSPGKLPALPVVYEDQWLVVVNKPAGLPSVPGKAHETSVYTLMRQRYPQATGPLIVHRLDMDTSGLLLVAKDKKTHQALQAHFKDKRIRKKYLAVLCGTVAADQGTINLPLRPDYLDRPRQVVDDKLGKPAATDYQVLSRRDGQTLVAFYPLTGRTHQLRVHAAHPAGLNCPIVGDNLYGHPDKRLYLHAAELRFIHPVTGQELCLRADPSF